MVNRNCDKKSACWKWEWAALPHLHTLWKIDKMASISSRIVVDMIVCWKWNKNWNFDNFGLFKVATTLDGIMKMTSDRVSRRFYNENKNTSRLYMQEGVEVVWFGVFRASNATYVFRYLILWLVVCVWKFILLSAAVDATDRDKLIESYDH